MRRLLLFSPPKEGSAICAAVVRHRCVARARDDRARAHLTPAATQGAAFAAASLTDAHAYGRAVLGGARVANVVVAVPIAGFASLVAPLGALLVAGVILARTPAARRIRIALARNPLMRVFRGLDDGDSGVYIAWIAGSATALTLALVTFG